MDFKELRQEIDGRFHLILTLAIFFPALISTFLTISEMEEKQVVDVSLKWTVLVGPLLFNYVFLAIAKKIMPGWVLKMINLILLIGIGLFVFPIILLTTSAADQTPSLLNYISVLVSLYGLPAVPFVLLALLSIGIIIYFIKSAKTMQFVKLIIKMVNSRRKH